MSYIYHAIVKVQDLAGFFRHNRTLCGRMRLRRINNLLGGGGPADPRILSEICPLLYTESTTYPSATEALFHPPCLFSVSIEAPASASMDAEVTVRFSPDWPLP